MGGKLWNELQKRYWYFVPTVHPGTFEIAPKDKKVYLIGFCETFEVLSNSWLIIAMLFHVGIVSLCVWPEILVQSK